MSYYFATSAAFGCFPGDAWEPLCISIALFIVSYLFLRAELGSKFRQSLISCLRSVDCLYFLPNAMCTFSFSSKPVYTNGNGKAKFDQSTVLCTFPSWTCMFTACWSVINKQIENYYSASFHKPLIPYYISAYVTQVHTKYVINCLEMTIIP